MQNLTIVLYPLSSTKGELKCLEEDDGTSKLTSLMDN